MARPKIDPFNDHRYCKMAILVANQYNTTKDIEEWRKKYDTKSLKPLISANQLIRKISAPYLCKKCGDINNYQREESCKKHGKNNANPNQILLASQKSYKTSKIVYSLNLGIIVREILNMIKKELLNEQSNFDIMTKSLREDFGLELKRADIDIVETLYYDFNIFIKCKLTNKSRKGKEELQFNRQKFEEFFDKPSYELNNALSFLLLGEFNLYLSKITTSFEKKHKKASHDRLQKYQEEITLHSLMENFIFNIGYDFYKLQVELYNHNKQLIEQKKIKFPDNDILAFFNACFYYLRIKHPFFNIYTNEVYTDILVDMFKDYEPVKSWKSTKMSLEKDSRYLRLNKVRLMLPIPLVTKKEVMPKS